MFSESSRVKSSEVEKCIKSFCSEFVLRERLVNWLQFQLNRNLLNSCQRKLTSINTLSGGAITIDDKS